MLACQTKADFPVSHFIGFFLSVRSVGVKLFNSQTTAEQKNGHFEESLKFSNSFKQRADTNLGSYRLDEKKNGKITKADFFGSSAGFSNFFDKISTQKIYDLRTLQTVCV